MGSSLPAAIDWLVEHIGALPAAAAPVVVSDGWPATRSDDLIVIGITPDSDEATATKGYAQLDRDRELETVQLVGHIWVRRAGQDALRAARATAFARLDAIGELIRADRRLGGAVVPGLPARMSEWVLAQTSDAREAGEGRAAGITWTLTWEHRG